MQRLVTEVYVPCVWWVDGSKAQIGGAVDKKLSCEDGRLLEEDSRNDSQFQVGLSEELVTCVHQVLRCVNIQISSTVESVVHVVKFDVLNRAVDSIKWCKVCSSDDYAIQCISGRCFYSGVQRKDCWDDNGGGAVLLHFELKPHTYQGIWVWWRTKLDFDSSSMFIAQNSCVGHLSRCIVYTQTVFFRSIWLISCP